MYGQSLQSVLFQNIYFKIQNCIFLRKTKQLLIKTRNYGIMIISPPPNTKEREEYDLLDLKNLFQQCQSLGISKDIEIRKYVCELKETAGKEIFCEKFDKFIMLVEQKTIGVDDFDLNYFKYHNCHLEDDLDTFIQNE